MAEKTTRVFRRFTDGERQRLAKTRAEVMKEFPPKFVGRRPAAPGLGATIRAAREAQGLTWYALAKRAAVPNDGTIRDIELVRDVKLSHLHAVAQVLGLRIELVPETALNAE